MRRLFVIVLSLIVVSVLGETNTALAGDYGSPSSRRATARVKPQDPGDNKSCKNKQKSAACRKRERQQDVVKASAAYDTDTSGASSIAQAGVPALAVYTKPSAPTPSQTLENPWHLDGDPNLPPVPLVLLVKHRKGDWVQVLLPGPPNGSLGWVNSADVALTPNRYRIQVSLADRMVTVFEGKSVLLHGDAAVGAPGTPTPTGVFYLRALLKAPDPSTIFGPYTYGLNAYSADGNPYGLSGTNDPSSLGTETTRGGVHISNDAITALAGTLPLGTPVEILARARSSAQTTPSAIGCNQQGQKSPSSSIPVTITFVNKTDQNLSIEWFDFAGALQFYGVVAPGARFDQETFAGHVWRLANPGTGDCVRIATAKDPTTRAPDTIVTIEGLP